MSMISPVLFLFNSYCEVYLTHNSFQWNFTIKFDRFKLAWSIACIEGSKVIISEKSFSLYLDLYVLGDDALIS